MTIIVNRRLALVLVVLAILGGTTPTSTADSVLIQRGSVWKYHDRGANLGTSWRTIGYVDSAWASGPAQLGYGDGDEVTPVSYGPNSSAKYITTYFRHTFSVADPTVVQSLTLNLLRDDGAVVYLNGTEVFRSNMPTGTIAYNTLAPQAIGGSDESTYYSALVNRTLLRAGSNVLAVEVHQTNRTSSDVSFDAELIASSSVQITRGPYLQMGTPSSVMIRWRTNSPTDSRVMYGTDPSSLAWDETNVTLRTEHAVTLTDLSPNTKYYYSVGTTSQTLAGGDASHYFITAPSVGTPSPTRIWVLGDSGTADANARAVRDAYYTFAGTTFANLWLMLGDNAYDSGLDSEFQAAVFNTYPATLRQSVLWPTHGNHDGIAADANAQSGPYFDIFSLPKQGEAGGLPSGTEAYYSFDYGNIHFISLESFETDRSATGPMMTWLENDLASTTQPWIIAFWHHPPYSKGSHNSDSELALIEMRQNALPLLEAAGVDLVLSGHSHSYERSFLIDGHYDSSSTFSAVHKKDGGSGRENGTGAYKKPAGVAVPHAGAVYAVAGSSGKISGGLLNHPAMFISLNQLGSMVLDVNGNRLDAKFITNTGAITDYFTIVKDADPTPPLRSNGQPTGTLAAGTTQTTVSLTTNENATCRYATTAGVAYASMPIAFGTTGGTSHSTSVGGLANGQSYSYYVRCRDTATNANPDDFLITFAVATPTDTTPPVRSNGQPTGTLAAGTTQTTVSLTTNENATCRYATTAGVAYASMPIAFGTTGGTSHSTSVGGLTNGQSYTYYVRCRDAATNANPDDFLITFTVASATSSGVIVFQSHTVAQNGAAPALSIGRPSGVVAGDFLIAQVTFEKGSSAGVTSPASWILVRRTDNGSDIGQVIFYKVATASEPASYTWTFSEAVKAAGGILRYTGVNTADPVVASSGNTGASNTLTAPTINATATSMLVGFFGLKKKETSLSVPAGMTGRYYFENPQDVALRGADETRSTAGLTGNRTSTSAHSDKWVAQLVALRPN